jgi:hypothetical protein
MENLEDSGYWHAVSRIYSGFIIDYILAISKIKKYMYNVCHGNSKRMLEDLITKIFSNCDPDISFISTLKA